ncbi:hypothetical protein TNCV_2107751 [Trichonephila clavipes]|nr:hypothetical protein TNCV_2107751 [Trichonephila clavipes]
MRSRDSLKNDILKDREQLPALRSEKYNVSYRADLSLFRVLGAEDLQLPPGTGRWKFITEKSGYPGPSGPLDARPKHPMDKPALVGCSTIEASKKRSYSVPNHCPYHHRQGQGEGLHGVECKQTSSILLGTLRH